MVCTTNTHTHTPLNWEDRLSASNTCTQTHSNTVAVTYTLRSGSETVGRRFGETNISANLKREIHINATYLPFRESTCQNTAYTSVIRATGFISTLKVWPVDGQPHVTDIWHHDLETKSFSNQSLGILVLKFSTPHRGPLKHVTVQPVEEESNKTKRRGPDEGQKGRESRKRESLTS